MLDFNLDEDTPFAVVTVPTMVSVFPKRDILPLIGVDFMSRIFLETTRECYNVIFAGCQLRKEKWDLVRRPRGARLEQSHQQEGVHRGDGRAAAGRRRHHQAQLRQGDPDHQQHGPYCTGKSSFFRKVKVIINEIKGR